MPHRLHHEMLNWSVDQADLPVFANLNGGLFSVLIGWVAELARDRNVLKAFAGFVAGRTVPFVFGPHYVTVGLGLDSGPAVIVAGTLFIPMGAIKLVIAAVIIPLAWHAVRRLCDKTFTVAPLLQRFGLDASTRHGPKGRVKRR